MKTNKSRTAAKAPHQASFNLTVVVTAHNEGHLLHFSLKSYLIAIKKAEEIGCSVELLLVCDRLDEKTSNYLSTSEIVKNNPIRRIETDWGDCGMARNSGARVARGEYLAFLDGDDLVSSDFLRKFWELPSHEKEKAIFHPGVSIVFGGENSVYIQPTKSANEVVSRLLNGNIWIAPAIVPKSVIKSIPYEAHQREDGYSYEDWHWNLQTLDAGIEHRTVPTTAYFVRRRTGSLLQQERGKSLIRRSTSFFFNYFALAKNAESQSDENFRDFPEEWDTTGKFDSQDYLWRYPDITEAISAGKLTTPYSHFLKIGKKEGRIGQMVQSDASEIKHVFNKLLPDFFEQGQIEADVYPTQNFLSGFGQYRVLLNPHAHGLARALYSAGSQYKYLVFAPWLKRGGADLVTLHHLKALDALGLGDETLFVITQSADNPWISKIPKRIKTLDISKLLSHLDEVTSSRIIGSYIIDLKPRFLFNFNSQTAWSTIRAHGAAIKTLTKTYVALFCHDYEASGRRAGYAKHLPATINHIEGVVSDNSWFKNELESVYGISIKNYRKFNYPVAQTLVQRGKQTLQAKPPANPIRVLWASRWDRQKRLGLLFEIARKFDKAIEFDVYGESVTGTDHSGLLESCPGNVNLYGSFDSLNDLNLSLYTAFVYTSAWDGLPNILIEVAAVGIPIVAPDVGGISELVNESTGFLVRSPNRAEDYARCLVEIAKNFTEAREKAAYLYADVSENRTHDAFQNDFAKLLSS